VGVWYDGAYWLIYNEDGSSMPPNIHFNVFVGDQDKFRSHTVTVENRIDGVSTILDFEFGNDDYFF
jgi:hypothetical protein